jgi:hypothetical protein
LFVIPGRREATNPESTLDGILTVISGFRIGLLLQAVRNDGELGFLTKTAGRSTGRFNSGDYRIDPPA